MKTAIIASGVIILMLAGFKVLERPDSGYYNKQYCPRATYHVPTKPRPEPTPRSSPAAYATTEWDETVAAYKVAAAEVNKQLPLATVASWKQ